MQWWVAVVQRVHALVFFLVFIVWSFCRSCSILENSSVYWKSWSGCNGLSIISTNKLGHLLLRHLQADVILFAINFPSKKWAPLEQKKAFRLPQQLYRLYPPNPLLLILNWEPHGTHPGFDSQMTSSFLRHASWMLSLKHQITSDCFWLYLRDFESSC